MDILSPITFKIAQSGHTGHSIVFSLINIKRKDEGINDFCKRSIGQWLCVTEWAVSDHCLPWYWLVPNAQDIEKESVIKFTPNRVRHFPNTFLHSWQKMVNIVANGWI